jgi:hypothetical protein
MAKKKEMNRTSGVAGRKLGRSEAIGFKLKAGMPLTGSASGVKSITTREAGEALTQGIVTLDKKGLKFAPEGLAMALPIGKVAKAAKALRAAGKLNTAAMLEARVSAKLIGQGKRGAGTMLDVMTGKEARRFSKNVFPRETDLASRALKAKSETGEAIKESMKYEFPFDRVIREADRIERKYGLTQRTAEEGIRQADKLKGAYKAVKFGPNPAYKAAAKEIARGKTAKGFGTVNAEGYAKLQKMQDPIVRLYTAAERGIKRKGK